MTSQPAAPTDQFVQSLARGLSVITAFDADHPEMSLSEVATRVDLSRATARRFLLTLVDLGYVRTDGRAFSLTPQVLRLGTAYLSGLGLPQIAQPHLERLSADVSESTSAAVLDGPDIVYVARVATKRLMTVGISVGTRFPAYATSMGRVLLAGLSPADLDAYLASTDIVAFTPGAISHAVSLQSELGRVRERGWALVDQELERGLRSMAAPITDDRGTVIGAVNVSASATPDLQEFVDVTVDRLLLTSAAISADVSVSARTASPNRGQKDTGGE